MCIRDSAYAVLNDGTSVFLKAMSFNVTKPTAKLTVEKQNGSNGTVEVTISNIQSKSGINSVLVDVYKRQMGKSICVMSYKSI